MKSMQIFLDKTAVSLSLLCMAHCLVLPVAMSIIPTIGVLPLEDELFHQLLVLAVIPISLIALTMGCKKHKRWNVLAWGGTGLSIVVIAALFGHDLVGEFWEKLLTFIGSLVIAWGHIQNYRMCRTIICH